MSREAGDPATPRAPRQSTLLAADGTELAVVSWPAGAGSWGPAGVASLVAVHGIAEHSGRYVRPARVWSSLGLDVVSFDLRGHGRSGGRRVYVDRWETFLDDLDVVLQAVRAGGLAGAAVSAGRPSGVPVPPDSRPVVLFGHSMGALIALDYACRRVPSPALLVLSAPPLRAAAPLWQRLAAPMLSRVAPTLVIANPIDGAQLSRDPAVGNAYFADPLVQPRSTTRLGSELFAAMRRMRGGVARLRVPTLVVHGEHDALVPTDASEPLSRVPGVERRVLAGLRHELLNEPEGDEVAAAIGAWVLARVT